MEGIGKTVKYSRVFLTQPESLPRPRGSRPRGSWPRCSRPLGCGLVNIPRLLICERDDAEEKISHLVHKRAPIERI